MMVSEQQAEAAVKKLRKIIEAAENSNQAGEDAAVMAAAAPDMAEALEDLIAPFDGDDAYELAQFNDPEFVKDILKARAALAKAKARGET